MTRQKFLPLVTLFVAIFLVAGCHSNPNVQKVRYLENSKRFTAYGKYREAAIQSLNALKVDKKLSRGSLSARRDIRASGPFCRSNC